MFFKKNDLKKLETGLPATGSFYSFRTSPYSEFSPSDTGRYAVFKILAVNEKLVAFVVLNKVWTTPPTLSMVCKVGMLHQKRFSHTGKLAAYGVNTEVWALSDLDNVSLLGVKKLSRDDESLGTKILDYSVGCSYSTLRAANYAAEGEWRWEHDHDAFVVESLKIKEKADSERTAKQERYQTRLKNLTWDKLLAEKPFERWSTRNPPFPSAEFTDAAREKIHKACCELLELGSKPTKAKVRTILRDCVECFNEADEAAGGVIETEEREDICAALEEMAFVAKQKSLVDEIDDWRQW